MKIIHLRIIGSIAGEGFFEGIEYLAADSLESGAIYLMNSHWIMNLR